MSLTDDEEEKMTEIFESMKEKEKILTKVNTENAEIMVHVLPMTNVLREDERKQPFSRDDLLEGAPARNQNSWQVPRLV
ncbi:MAG: Asp-tRNA(Asn)/Glu-tRNA(Gln) amidotransferase subunit GatC [Clostridia bacterium]|nr:Asp-tRNA(Asn)/Glu-tRNA(Gln) amidotransferase subunit GatC [Clostridia bacterium]